MKVQLVVVRGKPEGKVIPLVGPKFKIGRGETCHLRPNSEQVSREHAEFTIDAGTVSVRDLGSRNGTLVNGKALTDECRLKDRDLVQVGPLTFAVSISEAPAAKAAVAPAAPAAAKAKVSPEDVSGDEIDSWLLGEGAGAAAETPTAVYGGETITITAFKDAKSAPAKPQPPSSATDDEYERQQAEEEEPVDEAAETAEDLTAQSESEEEFGDDIGEDEDAGEEEGIPEEEFIDESNPFYAAKKAQKEQAKQGAAGPAKPSFKDTSDAANDILRRLMERRRASKG
jgi:pSer/pThr/pTyr-binding forkhead associated (FHA) protein